VITAVSHSSYTITIKLTVLVRETTTPLRLKVYVPFFNELVVETRILVPEIEKIPLVSAVPS
jgi:hypothetical protein